MRRLVVSVLETTCSVLDRIPTIERDEGRLRVFRFGSWGCRLGLARKSAELDDRWGTGVWYPDPAPERRSEAQRAEGK